MPVELPLASVHARFGARLAETDGLIMPRHYGDPIGEHLAVRGAAGLLDRSGRGVIAATGRDRAAFLQGMLANDVKGLGPGQGCRAAFLDVHGKILALLVVHGLADRLLLEMDRGLVEGTLAGLERYHFSEKVDLEDVTDAEGTLTLAGPDARARLERVLGRSLPHLPPWHHVVLDRDGAALRAVGNVDTGEEGFDLWGAPAVLATLWDDLVGAGARPVGAEAWETLRVEAGVVRYGRDVDAGTLLLEAPLEDAYSTSKGCYVGQEVVARVTYRGHVNRRLMGLELAGPGRPEPGTPVVADGREIGRVTSVAESPTLGRALALAYVRREHWDPGTVLSVGLPGVAGAQEATVRALPFYRARQPASPLRPAGGEAR